MTGILELPEEIRPFIGKFLDTNAIQACLLVSRSFHQSFEPILWQKVVIRNSKVDPVLGIKRVPIDVDALKTRTRDVHNYVIHDRVDSQFYELSFPHLKRLQLTDSSSAVSSRTLKNEDDDPLPFIYQKQVADQNRIVRLNPTTRTLVVTDLPATPNTKFWETIHSTWLSPQILHATGPVASTEEAANAFWKACTRFTELTLLRLTVEYSPILSTLTFPRIRHLNLETTSRVQSRWLRPQDHLVLMKACPQLKHLTWNASPFSSTSSSLSASALLLEFRQAIEQNHWPYLDSLDFCKLYINKPGGKELTLLLQDFPNRLTALRLENCQFNIRSLRLLKDPKFDSLRILKLLSGCGVTSKMALDILTSCPSIEVFRSTHIYAGDVDPSQPWVCKRLRSLTVCFIHRESTPSRAELDLNVYTQLAKMTDLTRLDLGQYSMGYTTSDPEFHLMDAMNTLDLRLKAGLGHLSTLSKLRFFGFAFSFQVTGEAELLWMMEHWKELRTLVGQLDGIERSALRAMEARGVDSAWRTIPLGTLLFPTDALELSKDMLQIRPVLSHPHQLIHPKCLPEIIIRQLSQLYQTQPTSDIITIAAAAAVSGKSQVRSLHVQYDFGPKVILKQVGLMRTNFSKIQNLQPTQACDLLKHYPLPFGLVILLLDKIKNRLFWPLEKALRVLRRRQRLG